MVSECGNLVQTENIKEDTTTWRGLFTGNFVVNVDWKELIAGMNRSLREWWKVKTSRYCGISQSSVIGKLRQEDHTLGGGGRGEFEPPLRPKIFILFLIFFAVADLTERRLLDCQDCQD